ncbi:MAG: serine hydrolase domain-containing protein [Phenylobacterium sp.]|uniref:serine hydrolase domain-containing protein n=1 Tax=Phenylobacterium sp. TaxID=1871053 RepID=UPI0027288C64|nr:serine hydrolase domain-containing protein [Phenylobacterium sp.]MDO8913604.1 serine hydrolase domain-containing protein [Phenylobacterium sp.]MDP3100789.1 serine hydrolase domain-containing protein [Phenylobacterium sp.]
MLKRFRTMAVAILAALLAPQSLQAAPPTADVLREIDQIFETWRLDSHVPGLVYGVVQDGRLVAVRSLGVQDPTSKAPVTADTRFRIASMSKAFTALAILKLRDEGRLSLDAPAETYVPEMRSWTYPTRDSRKIRVRDLLHHTAGFVTDDPWGDRQQPLSEAAFTQMLKTGVPFARSSGLAMEYSNFGYATLGRIITNVSGMPYQAYIGDTIQAPLGMGSTSYDVAKSPAERRANGYRWQDDAWVREPDMADGAFGAMGGVETTANDYARWVGFLLSAWPPRDDAEAGPVARATVREIVEGSNFPRGVMRATTAGEPCRIARTYGMGWIVIDDCDLGRYLTHGGGYPGYGSNVLLLPDRGVGIFALSNRTYAGPSVPVLRAALALADVDAIPDRLVPVSQGVREAYQVVRGVWAAGTVAGARPALAINFLMDRDEARWARDLARLKAEVGACPASEAVTPLTAMEATFTWTCEHGRIKGGFLLAPTRAVALQRLDLEVAKP